MSIGPIEPPYEIDPRYGLAPIWPPASFVAALACGVCKKPLTNGEPIAPAGPCLAHASCLPRALGAK